MTEMTLETPELQINDTGDELAHRPQCHDENLALCGKDLTGSEWVPEGEAVLLCAVCTELEALPCGCDCGCCDEVQT